MELGVATSGEDIYVKVAVFVILVFAIVLHEVAHGFVAYLNGDPTAKLEKRITLNPIAHIDPIGSIIVPILTFYILRFPFGWARPVPVNPLNYKRRVFGDITVSLAGVTANFLFSLVLAALIHLTPEKSINRQVLLLGVVLNCALFTFNLIPLPPLDGSHIFKYLLPRSVRLSYLRLGTVGVIILLVIMYTLQKQGLHIEFGIIGYVAYIVLFLTGHGWMGF
jgi:Zn-dependent protease